jgi:hypothetical protein
MILATGSRGILQESHRISQEIAETLQQYYDRNRQFPDRVV